MAFVDNVEIYDLETFPNIFTACFVKPSEPENHLVFEISDRKDDSKQLLQHLRKLYVKKTKLVGFNNLGFDYQVLHAVLTKSTLCKSAGVEFSITAKELHGVAQKVISAMNSGFGGGSRDTVREEDMLIPQVDLYKIHHFDNKARATSLKMLEFNMRSHNIEDLPYPVGKFLTSEEMDVLVQYNKHDVSQTLKFMNYSLPAIELREKLSDQYGFDCTNFNDTKIGKELFIRTLEGEKAGVCYIQQGGRRVMRQTVRNKIVIKDCILPYIDFSKIRPEFQAVLDWLKTQEITETKGVFSDLLESQIGDIAKYAEMVTKRKKLSDPVDKKNKRYIPSVEVIEELQKEYPLGWLETKELKSPKGAVSYYWCWREVETINVVINSFRYDFGVGGIHGAKKGIHKAGNGRKLKTLDVASYYPNLAIKNKVYPEHLGMTFCDVYESLYQQRKSYDKKHSANTALKYALNGCYGDSNNEYSPLYDPKYTMTITIGGQLSLCMLMGALINKCDAEIVMCNTDGFEFYVDEDKEHIADNIVKRWEEMTGLTMEGGDYETMWVRDVNSYLARDTQGNVKTKGAYEVLHFEKLGWHKNHSSMVISKAAYHHFVEGGDYKDFILNHKDEYDFMLRTKVPRNSRLVLVMDDKSDIPQQNICRYYPCETGGYLVKIMPPIDIKKSTEDRRLGIDTEWKVKTCNNMDDFSWDDLNYDYYIREAEKLISEIDETFIVTRNNVETSEKVVDNKGFF